MSKGPHAVYVAERRTLPQIVESMLSLIEAADGELPEDFGELELQLDERVSAYAAVNRKLLADGAANREMAKHYLAQAAISEKHAEDLRERLRVLLAMVGVTKHKTATASVFTKTSQHVEIDDEVFYLSAPDTLVKTVHTARKTEIAELLKAGAEVPGAKLVATESLVCR